MAELVALAVPLYETFVRATFLVLRMASGNPPFYLGLNEKY